MLGISLVSKGSSQDPRIVPVCVSDLDECLGGKFVDVTSDLKNSNVIVVSMIVRVVDNPLGRNPTA